MNRRRRNRYRWRCSFCEGGIRPSDEYAHYMTDGTVVRHVYAHSLCADPTKATFVLLGIPLVGWVAGVSYACDGYADDHS